MKECPECEGAGVEPDYYGCGDPDCCSPPGCWECGGTGELEDD